METLNKKNKVSLEEYQILKEDFNDLKRYLDELREILPTSIFTLSSFEVVVDINKTAEILSKYKPLEIIGQPVEILFYPKEEIEKLLKEVQKKGKIKEKEITLITKNKEKIPVSISVSLRKDLEGNLTGYFLAITDISKIKKYQKELENKTKELQEKIEELEKFQKLAVGRELKMVALKEEIEKLKEELEKYKGRQ